MSFHSIEFLVFFLVVFLCYWALNSSLKIQNFFLLVISYVFYAWWDWRFLGLIVFSTGLDFLIGLIVYNRKNHKKKWLFLSIFGNLIVLGFFKYYNFFASSFVLLAAGIGWTPDDLTLNIILPVGISFYTFQSLSYTIDIYKGKLKPTVSIVSFATYVSLFPQLVAGPIERATKLLPQVESKRHFDFNLFKEGMLQIFVGLFRKIAIADTLAIYVDMVYDQPGLHNASTILLATVFFAFQIYCDFAGYSDMAIGLAKLIGFRFTQNFNLPYFRTSVSEYWRNWHMSFSSWLRDYVYIPLGGSKGSSWKTYRNLFITMLIGGLWHGASWTFVLWGALHGIVLSLEKALNSLNFKFLNKISFLGHIYSVTMVVLLLIVFRAQNMNKLITCFEKLVSASFNYPFVGDAQVLAKSFLVLLLGLVIDFFISFKGVSLERLGGKFSPLKLGIVLSVLILLTVLFCSSSNSFIYFKF